MQKLSTKDFLGLKNYTKDEINGILSLSAAIKSKSDTTEYLKGKFLGMIFNAASTRTRVSFQVGAKQLGGHMEYLHKDILQISRGESLEDTANVLSRYLDGLVVRYYDMSQNFLGKEPLHVLSQHSTIPVINALDSNEHPCQVLADILTLKEKFGEDYKNKKIVVTWAYSRHQKSPGVPHSFLTAAAILGMNITFTYPKDFELDDEFVKYAQHNALASKAKIQYSNDLMEACEFADVIYVKSYKSLTLPTEVDLLRREQLRDTWQITEKHFEIAQPDAYFMNCMPFIRGEQVSPEVADHPKRSIIYDEAENRLHVQKAIMSMLLNK